MHAGSDKRVASVRVSGKDMAADAVVVAMGPWSGRAGKWLGAPLAISGQKYHSAVLRTSEEVRVLAKLNLLFCRAPRCVRCAHCCASGEECHVGSSVQECHCAVLRKGEAARCRRGRCTAEWAVPAALQT